MSDYGYDPLEIRHTPAHGTQMEQWEIGWTEKEALNNPWERVQANPGTVLDMLGHIRTSRVYLKILLITTLNSPGSDEEEPEEENYKTVWITFNLGRRSLEDSVRSITSRGRWPRLIAPNPGENQFDQPYLSRLHNAQRLRWLSWLVNRLGVDPEMINVATDAIVGWGVAEVK